MGISSYYQLLLPSVTNPQNLGTFPDVSLPKLPYTCNENSCQWSVISLTDYWLLINRLCVIHKGSIPSSAEQRGARIKGYGLAPTRRVSRTLRYASATLWLLRMLLT